MEHSPPAAPRRPAPELPQGAPRAGVVHVRHRHTERFTVVGNHLAQHPRLSATAIGIGVYIQSLPDGASVTIKALTVRFLEGEVTIGRAIRELETAGYLVRRRVPLGGGRVATRTFFLDHPEAVVRASPRGDGAESKSASEPKSESESESKSKSAVRVPFPVAGPSQGVYPATPLMPKAVAVPPSVPASAPAPAPAPVPASASAPGPARTCVGDLPEFRTAPEPVPVPVSVSAPVPASAPVPSLPPTPPPSSVRTKRIATEPAPVPEGPAPKGPAPESPALEGPAADLLARLRIADDRLLLSEEDVHRLAPVVETWLTRAATPEQITRKLTTGLPIAATPIPHPARFLEHRLTALRPPPLPAAPLRTTTGYAPLPRLPLITCDDCDRAFRSDDPKARCRDCKERRRRREAEGIHTAA
ncbi:hypothetical protein GBW32_13935 [Streptomyces tsukubensis]|uniref:DNA-binding protein n=1 Tax=Streptomyces tsukubensis TaxID=83656 RepID=A0A1V4A2G4_9ACTN|nr:hypothetical protein B1H18_27835 [Streptomyces tsukubensis]QFR97731.1 hypothetical protein GBW32_13935 [Streptomyces tsukubensis]